MTLTTWGYIDKSGKAAIPLQFDTVGSFKEGRAPASRNLKWGFIDQKGNFVIPPQFNVVEEFSEGLTLICTLKEYYSMKAGKVVPRKFDLIDKQGNRVLDTIYDVIGNFVNGYARIRIHSKTGMVDNKGKVILKPEWEEVGYVYEGLVPVAVWDNFTNKALYGYLNMKGDTIIHFKYSWAEYFNNGKAIVRIDPQAGQTKPSGYYIIDKSGKNCFSAAYANIAKPKEGIYIITDTGTGMFAVNSDCKEVIKNRYNDLSYLGAGYYAFQVKGAERKWGIMNNNEKQLVEPLFKSITLTPKGNFTVATLENKYGLLDNKGNWKVEPAYDFISLFLKVN